MDDNTNLTAVLHIGRSLRKKVKVSSTQAIAPHPQVLNAQGKPTGEISLLQKSDFGRVPLIATISRSLNVMRSHNQKREQLCSQLLSPENITHIDHYINTLRDAEHPTHDQVLQPIRRALMETALAEQKTLHLFGNLFDQILKYSIQFFNHSNQHPLDKTLSSRDQYRSLTNYWVNLILIYVLNNDDHDLQPGVDAYGYSYVYPYADNIMDMQTMPDDAEEPSTLKQVKKQFVKNIHGQLQTGQKPSQLALQGSQQGSLGEARVYELIEMIITNVDNPCSKSGLVDSLKSRSGLVDSLKAINHAQKLSLKQECLSSSDIRARYQALSKKDKKEIFDITIIKGAAAVLPNAYMQNPNMTKEQADLAAAVGYLGQFINDIEGIDEDLEEKRLTPATMSYLKHGHIDRFLVRVLVHSERLKRDIPNKFPNLPQNKIAMLLDICRLRAIATTVYAHQRNGTKGILSKRCIAKLEKEVGVELDLLAQFAKLEHEVFGGLCQNAESSEQSGEPLDLGEKLSDPNRLRDLVLKNLMTIKAIKSQGGAAVNSVLEV